MLKTITILGAMTAALWLGACESKDPPKHPEPLPATTADLSAPSDLPAATSTASKPPADPTMGAPGASASPAGSAAPRR